MIRTYLDWILSVPWGERSEERLDPAHAREVLDADHAGLETSRTASRVHRVRKLRKDREIDDERGSGAILTLIALRGPQDLDRRVDRPRHRREFVRMSLAAFATRPRSAATAVPTSAPCRAAWCARSATPGR